MTVPELDVIILELCLSFRHRFSHYPTWNTKQSFCIAKLVFHESTIKLIDNVNTGTKKKDNLQIDKSTVIPDVNANP